MGKFRDCGEGHVKVSSFLNMAQVTELPRVLVPLGAGSALLRVPN